MSELVRFIIVPRDYNDAESLRADLQRFAPGIAIDTHIRPRRKNAYLFCKSSKEVFEDMFDADLRWVTPPVVLLPANTGSGHWEAVTLPQIPQMFSNRIQLLEIEVKYYPC